MASVPLLWRAALRTGSKAPGCRVFESRLDLALPEILAAVPMVFLASSGGVDDLGFFIPLGLRGWRLRVDYGDRSRERDAETNQEQKFSKHGGLLFGRLGSGLAGNRIHISLSGPIVFGGAVGCGSLVSRNVRAILRSVRLHGNA